MPSDVMSAGQLKPVANVLTVTGAITVTRHVDEAPPEAVQVITDDPAETAVTYPPDVTVATDVFEEFQETSVLIVPAGDNVLVN